MASEVSTKQAPLPIAAVAGISPAPAPSPRRDAPASSSPGARSFADELAAKSDGPPPQKTASNAGPSTAPQDPRTAPDPKTPLDPKTPPDPKSPQAAAAANQPLKQLATGHRADVDNAPVVAFLTGHLERLDPAAIPTLVTGNEFLGDALGTADLGQFMNKATTVGELLNDLDLPESFVDDLEKLGIDLDQSITPTDLFRALGVDPARAVAELKSLKTNLETGGVGALVKRAQAMRPSAQMPADPTRPALSDSQVKVDPSLPATGLKTPAFGEVPRTSIDLDPSKAKLGTGVPAAALSPQAAMLAAGSQMAAPQQAAPQQAPQAVAPGAPVAAPKPGVAGLATIGEPTGGSKGAQATLQRMTGFDAQQMPDLLQVVDPAQLAQVLPDPAAPPQLSRATFDAFAMMGDRLRGVDTQVYDLTKVTDPTLAPVAGAGLARQAPLDPDAGSVNRLIQDALRSAAQPVTTPSGMPSAVPAQLAGQIAANARGPSALDLFGGRGLSPKVDVDTLAQTLRLADPGAKAEDLMTMIQSDPAAAVKAAPLAGALAADFAGLRDAPAAGRKVSVDDLVLAAPLAGAGREGGRAQSVDPGTPSGDRDEDRQNSEGDASGKFSELVHGHAPGAHAGRHAGESFGVHTGKAEAALLSPSERLDLMQKIVDRAATLSKEGGGIVRIDVGNAEIGRLELAVRMTSDDRVDLRILTSSDRVRDLMAAELGRLRDALGVQQVQLGKVEVGVNGRGPGGGQGFSGFAQGFNQQQQNGAFEGQREAAARVTPARRGMAPAIARAVAPVAFNPNGRLQIRA